MDKAAGRSGPRGAAKTRHLVEIASDLFEQKGFGAVSLDELARAANASKTTIYSRFSSKNDLFHAVIQHACATARDHSGPTPDLSDLKGLMIAVGQDVLERFSNPRTLAILFGIAEASRIDPAAGRLFWDSGPGIGARLIAEAIHRKNSDVDAFELGNEYVLDISGILIGRALLGFADFTSMNFGALATERTEAFLAKHQSSLGIA